MLSAIRQGLGMEKERSVQVGVAREGAQLTLVCLSGQGAQRHCLAAIHGEESDDRGEASAQAPSAGEGLAALVHESGCSGFPAVTCLDATAVISVRLALDAGLNALDQEAQVRHELAIQAGLPESELACDFVSLAASKDDGTLPVQAWGARQQSVNEAIQWLQSAGLSPRAVELSCLARQRAFRWWLCQGSPYLPIKAGEAVLHLACEPGLLRLSYCLPSGMAPAERIEQRSHERLSTVLGQALWLLEQARAERPEARPCLLLLSTTSPWCENLLTALSEQLPYPVQAVCAWMGLRPEGALDSERSFDLACGLALWQGPR